jgi:hypothetical protein
MRALLPLTTFLFAACPALAQEPVLPQPCAAQLSVARPGWMPYAPDDPNAPRYKGYSPKTIVSADLDSDGLADVAILAMFQQQHPVLGPAKGVAVFACLSSRKNELVQVSHIATGDSEFQLEAADSTKKEKLRDPPDHNPSWGLIWHHNSYACIDYWYNEGKFREGKVYCPDEH